MTLCITLCYIWITTCDKGQTMNRYSVTIRGDDWKEWCDRCYSMQDVIEWIIDQLTWCDNNSCFLNSEITVYIKGTDDLVAHKQPIDSLQDFIVGLAQSSKDSYEEEKKSVLEWLRVLEKSLVLTKDINCTYEEL